MLRIDCGEIRIEARKPVRKALGDGVWTGVVAEKIMRVGQLLDVF